jgi:hypothetical protein
MAAETPLTTLALGATSVADDIGFVALSDLACALKDSVADYRVIGDHMVTILTARWRLNAEVLQCELPFPDEVSALVLKSLATTVRSKDTDIADIWRCLEIAHAAGLGPADFTKGVRAESATVTRSLFSGRNNTAVTALATEQRLSLHATDARFTRIRALIANVLGPAS